MDMILKLDILAGYIFQKAFDFKMGTAATCL